MHVLLCILCTRLDIQEHEMVKEHEAQLFGTCQKASTRRLLHVASLFMC